MAVILLLSFQYNDRIMHEIDLTFRTMFAELAQRSLDASFEFDFPVEGRFVPVMVKDKKYWYFDVTQDGKIARKYVGPDSDPEIARRVADFKQIKANAKARRKLVSTLVREAGLAAPERFTGEVVQALAEAGIFRMRVVLVGTVAFQCYPGLLGIRFPSGLMMTGDADFAQFHSVSDAIDDSLPPILDVLRKVDPTFREVPHPSDSRQATKFENSARFNVEFLTPNTGSDEFADSPAAMSALGGAAAQPLRFLDFLIHEPVRSVMLHGSGVPVLIPAPERYAVHKLIVASRRRADGASFAKREKDVFQAGTLGEAMEQTRRHVDLATAYIEAWRRGPSWKDAISIGLSYMTSDGRAIFEDAVKKGLLELGERPQDCGLKA